MENNQPDGTVVTLLVQIGGYKELIINYLRMFGITEDEKYLENAKKISKSLVRVEEQLNKYVQKEALFHKVIMDPKKVTKIRKRTLTRLK